MARLDFRETDADSDGIPDSVEGNTTGGPDSAIQTARQTSERRMQIMMVFQIQ